ncbi:MAG: N-carbamoylputrescine amidase [Alphaproteobacteria bacterium]|jgi:N-carbamoylputrescine amidase
MTTVTVAATQMACGPNATDNLARADALIRDAAGQGANIVLLQELFETPYFPAVMEDARRELARPFEKHPMIAHMSALARELGIVLPVGFFERDGDAFYNSLTVIDADGRVGALYRKSHIPEGPGYEEKFYFSPGDTGFRVWETRYGVIGVGVCWDQWFPECARAMALQGAELLFYPTAIGNEPQDPNYDSSGHWRCVMQGHAAANMVPVVASNRVGVERNPGADMTFYGSSFIADHKGAVVAQAPCRGEAIIIAAFDLSKIREKRRNWGLFRDRRPDLYASLISAPVGDENT